MATVTIIGAGMMGTAMCWPSVDNGHEVRLVGTPLDEDAIRSIRATRVHPNLAREVPAGVRAYPVSDLATGVEGADLLINAVSSFGVDWFAEAVGLYLRPEVPVLSVTKGLEGDAAGNLVTLPVALDGRLPAAQRGTISFNAIAGPCIAHELAARRHTAVVFTGADAGVLTTLCDLLSTSYYHVWTSIDVIGVEVCAAMKNAYALGVALAVGQMEAMGPDGLANGYNPQAALVAQSCFEMRRLIEILGGDPGQVSWLPGAGDLYVTVFGGRTVRLGKLLGKGMPFSEAREVLAGVTLESVEITTRVARALPKLEERGVAKALEFPLLLHLDQILNHAAPVDIPWDAFFSARSDE
jgi:glycerol-3-phosphate dehydrogenase (NAD(P)+)